MPELTLHFAPDTCARVTMIALEEIGCPYSLEIVEFMRGAHRSDAFLALNPKGKVPLLVTDGRPLSENLAILSYLHETFPEARLLPNSEDAFRRAEILSDLSFCASGLHPIVTRLRIPRFFCDEEPGTSRVFEMAATAMDLNFAIVEERLAQNRWWYGDEWSILDAYINWVWFRVSGTKFDTSPYPNFARHNAEITKRPSVERALRIGKDVFDDLDRRGLAIKFEGDGAIGAASR
jgi:glutathione S-transferase